VWFSEEQPDPFSSGPWFRFWQERDQVQRPLRSPPVARSRSFELERALWLPPIGVAERPGIRQMFGDSGTIEELLTATPLV